MGQLSDFLSRNSSRTGKPLPLIHTCQSYSLRDIMSRHCIRTHYCDVFQEELNYFFVGRPAYKKEFSEEAADWELPSCFVFSYDVEHARRIYPFDTGAFSRGLFPSFIQMMNREEFDVSSVPDAPSRIIGTFFSSAANYFRLFPITEDRFVSRYSLGPFDAEVRALHRLIVKTGKKADKSTDYKVIDDRRSTIEVQFDKDKLLQKGDLLAVILPEPYLLEPSVVRYFRSLDAKMLSYQVHPFNPNFYYGIIYEKIANFFRKSRLL